jgi:DNA polymerase III delta' subunit
MGFQSFIGNTKVVDRLRQKLRQDRFPQALIFAGPEGVGKHTLATMVAKALNCTNAGPTDFCDECTHCRKINSGTHPDVTTVTLEDEATQIKIAQVRRVLEIVRLQPLEGRNKVFLIDPANLLNPEAANALLKGLEEPPEHTFFILIAINVHELLLTIRSRCQVYHFAPVRLEDIRDRGGIDELTVRWSQGSIGKAFGLDLGTITQQREIVLDFIESAVYASNETLREMLNASAELSRTRQDFSGYLGVMAVLLGDILYIAVGNTDKVVNIDMIQRLERAAQAAPTERWIRVSEFLRVMESGLKSYTNRQMLTDTMALAMAEISNDISAKSR